MMARSTRGARITALLAAAASAAVLAACGSSDDDSTPTTPSAPAAAVSPGAVPLPAALQGKDSIDIAAVSDYPPLSFADAGSTKIIGFNIDLLDAISGVLGVKFNYVNTTFDSLVPSLKAGRQLIAAGGASDSAKNQTVTLMIDYLNSGAQLAVQPGNPKGITDLTTACGHSVAVLAGSVTYNDALSKASSECEAAGKPKIQISTFPSGDAALLALTAGRVDADFDGTVAQAYRVKNGQKIEVMPTQYIPTPVGFQVLPEHRDIAETFVKAIQVLIDNGTYKTIIDKWELQAGSLETAGINLGGK